MRTVLLGPNGQLGTDIRAGNAARAKPLDILCIDRAKLDLSDIDAAITALRSIDFDCLINCSSYHKTDDVERNAQLAFAINAHLPQALARLCAEKGARLVHISTDYVFGGQAKRAPLTEADGKAPINVYGASKGMGEDLVLRTSADAVILRVASLFGVAGASGKGGNFVETMIRFGREKGHLRVVADQMMSPTSTVDIAAALFGLLDQQAPRGVWHVVNSGSATWHEFAAEIIKRTKIAAQVEAISSAEFPTPAARPPYSVLDNAKLGAAIGKMRPWQDALDSYLAAKGY
ncbi:MAG: dTDP-4-dehydrorhamnose reductase [Bradyrhizobium sp.]|nr:dTDP-4-dehydrorhamnose reductase [Bradyrhizobium sp.]